jgi:Putative MetA-pathway of phenol degradation
MLCIDGMRVLWLLLSALIATSARAELRDLCVDRPGLGTPACTIDPGHVIVEVGLVAWTLDRQPDMRTDTIVTGDFLVRMGLDDTTEAQFGWLASGQSRTRDIASGSISRVSGGGDIVLALRKNVSGPNGPVAVQGFVTLPTGGATIGAGDWGAGILVPLSIDLGSDFSVDLTPEVDAAVDQDRSGRHLAFGSTIGFSAPLTKALTMTAELSVMRDDDPAQRSTMTLASTSVGYQTDDDTQIDFGAVAGLNSDSPDLELYLGISRRF